MTMAVCRTRAPRTLLLRIPVHGGPAYMTLLVKCQTKNHAPLVFAAGISEPLFSAVRCSVGAQVTQGRDERSCQ